MKAPLFVALLALAAQPVLAADYSYCVNTQTSYEKACGSPTDVTVTVRNVCSQPIRANWCVERANGYSRSQPGRWDCNSTFKLDPGETTSSFTCSGTGVVQSNGCEAMGNCQPPRGP
jgi:hypothetical protein